MLGSARAPFEVDLGGAEHPPKLEKKAEKFSIRGRFLIKFFPVGLFLAKIFLLGSKIGKIRITKKLKHPLKRKMEKKFTLKHPPKFFLATELLFINLPAEMADGGTNSAGRK